MTYLDTKRFDRLSDEEVLDRIGALLAVAIGRREQQRQLTTQFDATAAPSDDPHLAALDFSQLVTDPLEARIIMHLHAAGHANAREVATALGLAAPAAAQKLARLCAAGLCRVEDRSRPACYRLRTEYTSN